MVFDELVDDGDRTEKGEVLLIMHRVLDEKAVVVMVEVEHDEYVVITITQHDVTQQPQHDEHELLVDEVDDIDVVVDEDEVIVVTQIIVPVEVHLVIDDDDEIDVIIDEMVVTQMHMVNDEIDEIHFIAKHETDEMFFHLMEHDEIDDVVFGEIDEIDDVVIRLVAHVYDEMDEIRCIEIEVMVVIDDVDDVLHDDNID